MPATQKTQNYLRGALYLSIALSVVKVIGAFYKLPIQNLLTEEGGSLYDAAYRVYATLFTLATAGLPVAISKMVSESETKGIGESKRIFQVAQILFLFIGLMGAMVVFFGAPWIAAAMNAPYAVPGIRAIAPSVLFVGLVCPFKGFFQGQGNMKPTAVSEILEAAGRLIFGVGLAVIVLTVLVPYGDPEFTNAQRQSLAAGGAILGVSVGLLMSAVFLMSRGRKHRIWDKKPVSGGRRRRVIAKQMLALALPVMLASSVLSVTNLIDVGMMRNLLVANAGFTMAEMELYMGSYSYAVTLFNLPAAFIVALAISLLPAVTAFKVQGNYTGVQQTVRSAVRVTALLAAPAAIGYITLSGPILTLLYPERVATGGVAIAAPLLQVLGLAVIFVCTVTVTNSILQALGLIWVPIVTMGIGCLAKIICTYVLVSNPEIHINGGPIGTLICYALITTLNLSVILWVTRLRHKLLREFVKPLFSAALMGTIAVGSFQFWEYFLNGRIAVVLAIGMAGLAYFILLVILGGLKRQDLELLPGGRKMAGFLRIQ